MKRVCLSAFLLACLCFVLGRPVLGQTKPDVREMEKLIKSKKAAPAKKNTVAKPPPAQPSYNAVEHEENVKSFLTTLIDKALQENPEHLQFYIDPQLDTTQTTIVSTLTGLSALKKSTADSLQISWHPSSRISAPVLYKNKHYTQVQLLLDVTIKSRQPDSTLAAVKAYVSSMSYRLNKMLFQTLNPAYHFLPTGTLLESFDAATGEGDLILFEEIWLSRKVSTKNWLVTRTDGPLDKDYMPTVLIPKSVKDKADANLQLKIPKTPEPVFPAAALQASDSLAVSQILDSYFEAIGKPDTAALKSCLAPSLSLFSEPKNILVAYDEFRSIATIRINPAAYQTANDGIELNGKRYRTMFTLITTTLEAKGEDGREVLKLTYPTLKSTLDITGDLLREKFQLDEKMLLIEMDEKMGKLIYYSFVPTYLVAPVGSDNWKIVFETGDLPLGVVGR